MNILRDFNHVDVVLRYYHAKPVDPQLAALVLALEDKRFHSHFGVDLLALSRAFWRFLSGHANGGASTIDMQLVRTITGRRERTFRRKFAEIVVAVMVRRRFGAERILQSYVGIAYTGYGLTGLEAAARRAFGKGITLCAYSEKALVASMLLAPFPRQASLDWWERVNLRANFAMRRILNSKPITSYRNSTSNAALAAQESC